MGVGRGSLDQRGATRHRPAGLEAPPVELSVPHCQLLESGAFASQVPQLTEVSWVYNTLKTVKFCEVATDFVDSSGGLHKIGGALM